VCRVDSGTPGGGWIRRGRVVKRGRGRVVRKVRHNRHLSHGEIVLVTNDDDILGYKA
jgi:hypothetical protein